MRVTVSAVLCLVSIMYLCRENIGCVCDGMTATEKYCGGDFALKVRVKSKLKIKNNQQLFDGFYRVHILKTYKINYTQPITKKRRVYTSSNSAKCGVNWLQKGTVYLITGRVSEERKRLEITACTSLIETTMDKDIKRLLRRFAKHLTCVA